MVKLEGSKGIESKMTGAGVIPSVAGGTATLPIASVPLPGEIKKSWMRRVAPCLAFLAAFSTAMALLLIWSEAAAQRRHAFDANMTRDYVFGVSMDNPQLVAYIREVHFKKPTNLELHNITETPEEKFLVNFFKGKRNGVYLEYINHAGAISTSSWLEARYGWHGLLVLTDFRSFFEACKSYRNPKTRAAHACLSTDKDTKEITYHQESEVRVTKLSEGPNSLIFSDEGIPTMRLKCFPLYSVLLAYNQTAIDYFSLDSIDSSDSQVLDTIPWDIIRISVLSIRTSNHQSEADVRSLIDKLSARRYKLVNTTDTASFLAVGVGTALAWTSPILPQLHEKSFLPVSKEEGSWVSSLLAMGAIVGALPAGAIADKLGRKRALLLLSGPFLISWTMIIFARSVWILCVARFIVGIAVGAACVQVPSYIAEIASPSARGTLGAMFQLFLGGGILMSFVLGAVTSYTIFAILCGLVEIIFIGSFLFMPESPSWLVGQGRKQEATKALETLRGDDYDPSDELEEMQREAEANASRKSSIFDLIRTKGSRKAVLASFGVMAFQQLSGINAVIFYTVDIFKAAGSSMSPDVAAIVVALVQFVMSGVAALIVDRAGRKPLLIFSSTLMGLSLITLGIYFKLKDAGDDVSNLGWLPLTSLTLFMIAFSVGLGPIAWMLMPELFTIETKAVASGLAVMLNWFLVFLVTKTFPAMKDSLGSAVTFWIFAGIMIGASVFEYFFVPETKGKTLQEIQNELNGLTGSP